MKRTILLVVAIIIAVATNLPATTPASPSAPSAGSAQEYIQKASNPPGFEQPQGTTTSTAPVGSAGEDVLSEDWLEPHNAAANACANSGDPHDVLKEKLMIEHGLIRPAIAPSIQRQETLKEPWLERRGMAAAEAVLDTSGDPFEAMKEKLLAEHGMLGPARVNPQMAPTQRDDEYSIGLRQ